MVLISQKSLFIYGTHIDFLSANVKLYNMRPKAALSKLNSLFKTPSFTSHQAAKFGVDAATLGYYVKCGELERVGRGVYRSPSAPTIDEFQWEDLVSAIQTVKNGVICLTSALAIYGLTEEIPRQHWIAIRNTTRHRTDPSTKVIRMRNLDLGKSTIKMSSLILPIFDRERTIVDSFRYLSRETAIKALKQAVIQKGKDRIDLEKIRKYAQKLHVDIQPYLMAVTT